MPYPKNAPLAAACPLLTAIAALALTACGPSPGGDTGSADAAAVAELRVCFPENDPPRSVRSGPGFDVDVALAVAGRLGRRLVIVWIPEREQTDIESTDIDYMPLLTRQCDMQLSIPGADAIARFRRWLVLSEPYYGAGFELIPPESDFRFGQPFVDTVAVRANTVAHLALDGAGVPWSMQASNEGIVEAVASGRAAAGLVWGPYLALIDIDHSPGFQAPPVLRWNLHAAVLRGNPLLDDLDRAFATPAFQSRVRGLLAKHRIPVRGPFATAHSADDLKSL